MTAKHPCTQKRGPGHKRPGPSTSRNASPAKAYHACSAAGRSPGFRWGLLPSLPNRWVSGGRPQRRRPMAGPAAPDGARNRSQWRGRGGFSPPSLFSSRPSAQRTIAGRHLRRDIFYKAIKVQSTNLWNDGAVGILWGRVGNQRPGRDAILQCCSQVPARPCLSLGGPGRLDVCPGDRNPRHRQVFGLTGIDPVLSRVTLPAVASRPQRAASARSDGFRSCSPLRGSPGFAPGSLLRVKRWGQPLRSWSGATPMTPINIPPAETCVKPAGSAFDQLRQHRAFPPWTACRVVRPASMETDTL